ncbi:MAG: S1 RNA-binding domain-containing protein, partial [Silvanigrellaceae bacterium]|nr:S1 RNA-binding domain-containing protein [Silvanigrellaceae bacterium]
MGKFRYLDAQAQLEDPFSSSGNETQTEFAKLLEMDTSVAVARKYRTGESVSGMVVSTSHDYIFVDLGGKNTGCISSDEFLSAGISLPKVGETLSAFVRSDNGSEVVLTRSLRRGDSDNLVLQQAFESQIPIEAKVDKLTKGGFEALIGAKRCFVPLSQMDIFPISNTESYLGSVFKFIIIEFKNRNIVLSRRQLLREEQELRKSEILETLEVGQVVKVKIARLTEFGAFASLDGIDCLIPLSELAWKRVKKADEVVSIDEVVNVKVLKIERAPKLKILLSLKDAGEDPWIGMRTRLNPG